MSADEAMVLTAVQSRQLAAALLNVADEAEAQEQRQQPGRAYVRAARTS